MEWGIKKEEDLVVLDRIHILGQWMRRKVELNLKKAGIIWLFKFGSDPKFRITIMKKNEV